MSKLNLAQQEAQQLKEQSKKNDYIKKMIQDEIKDQKRSKRDEVRQVEDIIRDKLGQYKDLKVKFSKDNYQQRMAQVSTMMMQKSEEIQNLEAMESHKLQALQMTKKIEEERITKFERFMDTQKQLQERRLNQQMERLHADKIKYRSPISMQNTSTICIVKGGAARIRKDSVETDQNPTPTKE